MIYYQNLNIYLEDIKNKQNQMIKILNIKNIDSLFIEIVLTTPVRPVMVIRESLLFSNFPDTEIYSFECSFEQEVITNSVKRARLIFFIYKFLNLLQRYHLKV